MCGIAGILDLNGRQVEKPALERLCARLAHRGPDEEGFHVNCSVGLGQRRLSIIDLTGGQQPICNEDGTIWVTFNGEIYNFQELRSWLERAGHRFATQSDTEVIVHAYEEEGVNCVQRFRGMFAFAIWDARQHQLFLCRDRVGKKPLFYTEAAGQFLFASELQGILEHPQIARQVDLTALNEYLTYGYIPAPRTGFKGIFKLPPAHYLTLRARRGTVGYEQRIERYWQLTFTPKYSLSEEEAAEGLLEVLHEAIRLRLIADVPVGALLSGGVDSSIVVALMSRLSRQPVKTFSIGFDEHDFNERSYARLVAKQYTTEHHEFVVRPRALEILPTLVRHYGEPFADSSAIPSYYVARLTRPHVKVVLNGDGGDECFGGYERYLGSALADHYLKLPALVRKGLLAPLSALIPDCLPRRSRLRQAKRFLQVAELPFAQRYLRWVGHLSWAQRQELCMPGFLEQLAEPYAEAWLLRQFDAVGPHAVEPLDILLAVDVRSYLPFDLLVKMDIATMANSLEARSPFLDQRVMEFAARLPGTYKIRGATLKRLLKKVGRMLLPAAIINRRKMGFGMPVGRWMRRELRPLLEDVLLSPQALGRDYFRPTAVRELVRAHLTGTRDHAVQLWALLWLELWHREFKVTA